MSWRTRILAIVWLVLVAGSFLLLWLLPAQGDGFTRGENRLVVFLAGQALALMIAIVLAVGTALRPRPLSGTERLFGFGPVVLGGLLWLTLAGLLAWAVTSMPAVEQAAPPGPVTTVPAG